MRLADEVCEQLEAFSADRLRAPELSGFLDSLAQELHAPGEEGLRRLVGEAHLLLSELSQGDRDAVSARREAMRIRSEIEAIQVRHG